MVGLLTDLWHHTATVSKIAEWLLGDYLTTFPCCGTTIREVSKSLLTINPREHDSGNSGVSGPRSLLADDEKTANLHRPV